MLRAIAILAAVLGAVQARPAAGAERAGRGAAFCTVTLAPGAAWQPSTAATRAAATRGLVRGAAAVRARVVGFDSLSAAERARWGRLGAVRLLVLEAVPGDSVATGPVATDSAAVGATLRVRGELVERDDFNRGPVPYESARTDAMRGACFAYAYRLGAEYLLLLRRGADGALTPYWAPLLPVNEQVRGADDPWVTWVRTARATTGP